MSVRSDPAHRRLGLLAVLCGGTFLLALAVGRVLHPGPDSAVLEQKAKAAPGNEKFTATPTRFRAVTLDELPAAPTGSGALAFAQATSDLTKLGLSEEHAQWLALRAMAARDFGGSFATAQQAGKLKLWAGGAAMEDLRKAVDLIAALDPDQKENAEAIRELAGTLGREDPKLGLEKIGNFPATEEFWNSPEQQFFSAWATVDRAAALAEVQRIPERRRSQSALWAVMSVWGREDREGLLEWANGQDGKIRQAALQTLSDSGGARDPRVMLELAQRYPKIFRGWGISNLAEGFLRMNGTEGWYEIRDLDDSPLRGQLTSSYMNLLAEHEPAAFFKLAQALPVEELESILRRSSYTLAWTAPAEMADLLINRGLSDRRAVSSLTGTWADLDPDAAFRWSEKNLKGTQKLESLGQVLGDWFGRDPAAAAKIYADLPAHFQAKFGETIAGQWAEKDPLAALTWAQSKLGPLQRDEAVESIFSNWEYIDPMGAAEAVMQLSGEQATSAVGQVSCRLTQVNPQRAVDWALRLPDQNASNQAANSVFQNWARTDPAGAAERLDAIEPGDFRDRAIQGFVQTVAQEDPAAAADWAYAIRDEKKRGNTLQNTLRKWGQSDRAGAAAFAQGIEDAKLRDRLLKNLPKAK